MADQQVPQIPDTEIFIGNQFAGKDSDELDNLLEERRVEVDKLNEKSSDLWTQEENEEYKKLSAEIDAIKLAKLADENANCIARETAKGFTLKDAPECEKFFNSVAFQEAIEKYNTKRDLPDPCGTSELSKINTELTKFFTILKGIKKYGEVYINGTINRIQNITALVRNASQIIGAVLKTLINRLRDFLLDQIRKGLEALVDLILPTIAKAIKNTIIQAIIDNIFCAFKDVVKGLANLVVDFLYELIGKVVNIPFCAAQQFTNALVNNIAAIVDKAVGPILNQINDILGGVAKIVGNVFQALDYILGFEAFLCAKPNCPEIKEFKASPWGGPTSDMIDDFNNFLAPLGGRQTPTAEGIIGSVDDFISGIEIFGSKIGDSPSASSDITKCDPGPFECGPPKIEIFGGGGSGAIAEAIVDNVGRTIGVNLRYGGSGYVRPPFVSFVDSCENTFTQGYAVISEPGTGTGGTGTGGTGTGTGGGEVIDIILTTAPTPAPPRDGRTEFDPPSDTTDPSGNDFVVCLEGFRVLNTGTGYTINDSITITPNVPNLQASVRMSEFGQIVDIQIRDPICGLSEYPEIIINSDTGEGAEIQPILSFTPIQEFEDDSTGDIITTDSDSIIKAEISSNDINGLVTTLRGRKILPEKQEFTRKNLIRIVDCVS